MTPRFLTPAVAAVLAAVIAAAADGRRLTADGSADARRPTALTIVHVGDINFARGLASNYILAGRGREVFAGVRDALTAADVAIGNLESVLRDRGDFADPPGIRVFAGPHQGAALLRDAGFDVVATSNNHAWDHQRAGILESLAHLDSAGVGRAGTGATVAEAWRPAIVQRRDWTVAVFSLTLIFNHPSMSVVGTPAACCVAWADTARFRREARYARDSLGADVVIVSVHQGLEYRDVPRWDEIRVIRGLARAGADAVVGHHPHVPQGIEWVDGKPILYSLGNFVFRQNSPWTRSGLWAELTFERGAPVRVRVLPVVAGNTPRFADGSDSAATMLHLAEITARLDSLPAARPRRTVNRTIPRPRTP